MHELSHEFTSRKVSPWGGIKLFHRAYQQSGMESFFANGLFPFPESNRGYDPRQLIEQFMTATVLGSRRLAHCDYLRTDEVLREVFGWNKGIASASTLSRFFGRIDQERSQRLVALMFKHFWDRQPIVRTTIDIDSTVIQRYGDGTGTEGAAKGYNPRCPGRPSHHPIMAFCADLKMVCNTWMRAGNVGDSYQVADFVAETIQILGGRKRVGLVRGDAGFFSNQLLELLEGQLQAKSSADMYVNHWLADVQEQRQAMADSSSPIDYIVRAKLTTRLSNEIAELDDTKWHADESVLAGAEYAELLYKSVKWSRARRIVVMRRVKKNDPAGIQPKLFAADERLSRYTFMAFVTNLQAGAASVHKLYNGRAESENRIKELKYDYGADGYALSKQSSTEMAFALVMMAFNIMGLLKQYVLKNNQRLSTIRFQCIAIGSYLVSSGRKKKMKLSAEGKRRHFLEHIFNNIDEISKALVQI